MSSLPFSSDLPITLEPMQAEDLDEVLVIEHDAFTMPWSPGMFLSELRSTTSHLLVARVPESQGAIVGYIGYRVVVDEMHVVIIAVHPDWRRRGIATQMLGQAMVQARRHACRRGTLEVRISNRAAQNLYYHLGFAPVGTRRRYYSHPTEDALILWRDPL